MNLTISSYNDFKSFLDIAGFSMGGDNSEGIFTFMDYAAKNIKWHTEIANTDPWEWRSRIFDENGEYAYGKFFLKKTGYITRAWLPYFIAVRRKQSVSELYLKGYLSSMTKRIYEILQSKNAAAMHELRLELAVSKEDKSLFERSLVELQMRMYITMCGKQQKLSKKGEGYGWNSTVFCTVEEYFGEQFVESAKKLEPDDAYSTIKNQILTINPNADETKIKKFISPSVF